MQKRQAMFNIFIGIFQRGNCTISKSRNTHKRAAAPQHAADHSHRIARGSSGSCSANGPGRCHIFANYCCSVRVCARGTICGLTSRQHLEKKYLVPISGTKHPFSVDFPILEICQKQELSPHAVYADLTVGESCVNQYIYGLHRGT